MVKDLIYFYQKKIKGLTRSFIKKIINKKEVKINNIITCSPSKKLKLNDIVLINIVEKTENKLRPKKIKLEVFYEDDDLLIINKKRVWLCTLELEITKIH